MDQATINLLIKTLTNFVEQQRQNIQTPMIKEKIDYYTKKIELYTRGIHGEENLFTLGEEDISLIPEDKKKKFRSMYNIYLSDVAFGGENYQSTFTSEQTRFIRGIFHDLLTHANEQLEYYNKFLTINLDDNLINQIGIVEDIIARLKNNSPIMNEEIELISGLINNTSFAKSIDIEDRYTMTKYLAKYLLSDNLNLDYKGIIDEDEKDEEMPENEKKLTDKELEDLFSYYSYDFNLVSPTSKENLKVYGKIDKMASIFETMRDIKIEDSYVMDSLPNILIYSTPEIVTDIINGIKSEDMKGHSLNKIFNSLLVVPSIFIKGRRLKRKRTNNPEEGNSTSPENEIIAGSNNNFNQNKEFFKNHNQNINEIAVTCPSVLAVKHQTLTDSFAKLLSYGVKEDIIFKKKSCLEIKDIYRGLDRLIELNTEEYFQKYVVKAVQFDDDVYKKMLIARKLGLDIIKSSGQMIGAIAKHKKDLYERANINESQVDTYLDLATPEDPELNELYSRQIKDATYNKNSSILNNPYIEYLENNCKRSELKYLINGMFISRPKVLRIYEILYRNNGYKDDPQLLLFALTYNSFFSKEQYENIKNTCESIAHQLGSR